LVPVTAALNMDNYLGDVYVFTAVGGWEMIPYGKVGDEYSLILVPAPLPVSWIVNISFKFAIIGGHCQSCWRSC
jgi:hypothetical protein